jgi:hypothetical protein
MHASRPAHRILLDLIALMKLSEETAGANRYKTSL